MRPTWPIAILAAKSPMPSSARPAAHIHKAVPEKRRKTARTVDCIDLPNRYKLQRFYDRVGCKTAVAGLLAPR